MKPFQSERIQEQIGDFYQQISDINHEFLAYWYEHTLFHWDFLYVITNWKIMYSFPIYFFIYLLAHKLSTVKHFNPL